MANNITSQNHVYVLFIGAGNITFGNDNVLWNHSLRVEKFLGSRLRVIGIVDPSLERVNEVLSAKATSAAAPSYIDCRHFLSLEDANSKIRKEGHIPDIIILGAPPHFRGTQLPWRDLETRIIAAFGSKPAIFCEKPVSTARPDLSQQVLELFERSGNTIAVGYMLRYLKVVQKATSIIRDNKLRIMSVGARYTCAYSKIRKIDWWDKSKQCGPIVEQATHFADLCRYLGGEINLRTVHSYALEHDEPAGKLMHQAVDESQILEEERIPRATISSWKYTTGALGSLTHIIGLHGIRYSNEIVVVADGYQLRLVDLYTTPTLYVRSPVSEKEELFTYRNDDPFYSEFAALFESLGLKQVTSAGQSASPTENGTGETLEAPNRILSSYNDAWKTYEFTWRIRDESERTGRELRDRK
ncbi:hypothetical protein N7474_006878 [Penicillium riverlandense]|uniref:uncharacterized protein n=1 Tax=Penicillium riverlandense TaxID=1903569 RepID=UPI0025498003|nr:uncharacterized protein N7474_006878 [Penicillium riverlandense]KAJ5815101.1 hypothetical protein N7474_006878 [Penicillium riverlandense]